MVYPGIWKLLPTKWCWYQLLVLCKSLMGNLAHDYLAHKAPNSTGSWFPSAFYGSSHSSTLQGSPSIAHNAGGRLEACSKCHSHRELILAPGYLGHFYSLSTQGKFILLREMRKLCDCGHSVE